jgi:hypothetical protein
LKWFGIGGFALAASVAAGGAADQTRSFARVVTPFAVADEAGRPFDLPFLGGFDVPRPQFADIDADGDHDLFLQEFRNDLRFFENTGTATAPRYEWRTDRYGDLAVGEWYRFVDLDADGDLDLLAEQPFSNIRFYRNTGTKQAAAFEPGGTLNDTDGQPIFLDRQNIPAIVDVDCDGRLDLFIGRVEGLVTRYEADAPGSLKFAFLTDHFEDIEIIGRSPELEPGPSMRHGANALAFADFDNDKDLDLFWGDFFEPGVLLIENIGATCSTPSFKVEPVPVPYADTRTSGYNAPMPIDVDFDGDLDLFMGVIGGANNPVTTAADNFYYFERTAKDRFELRTRRFLHGLDFGSESVPAAGDLDGDGDLDLIVGNKIDGSNDAGRLTILRNVGTRTAPSFRQEPPLKLVEAYHLAPALGDLDGDGDLDLLVGTWNQDVRYFRNQGTVQEARWVEEPALAITPPRASLASPVLADIDGDRDLDLFIGTAAGAIVFYRNDGTAKGARWTLVTERLGEIAAGRRSRPAFVDMDGDGALDLVLGREEEGTMVFRNAGGRPGLRFVEDPSRNLPVPPMSAPIGVDLDGDGRPEILAGTVSGGLVYWK